MSFDAREVPLCGPAAVAVHDDRDVLWQAGKVHLSCERLFWRSGLHGGENVLKRHGSLAKLNLDNTVCYGQLTSGPIHLVIDRDQEQSVRRRGGTGLGPIPGSQNVGDAVGRPSP